jgi:hypothetical protein
MDQTEEEVNLNHRWAAIVGQVLTVCLQVMKFGHHDIRQFHCPANFQVLVTSFVTAATSTILQHQYFRSSGNYLQMVSH